MKLLITLLDCEPSGSFLQMPRVHRANECEFYLGTVFYAASSENAELLIIVSLITRARVTG